MIAPIVILAIWGGSYLFRCILLLAAPGVPLDFKYMAPAGELHITAESYAIDLKTGKARITKPKITNPKGAAIAYADFIYAEGLPLLQSGTRRVLIDVRNAYGTVTREASGEFDIFKYLPARTQPPSAVPFSVILNSGHLKLIDLSGGDVWVQSADAHDVHVDGFGDQWVATAQAAFNGVGNASAMIENLPARGILVRAQTKGMQVARLLERFKRIPEGRNLKVIQPLHADELRVVGPVSFFLPKGKGFEVETALEATGRNVRYGDQYAAEKAAFKGHVSEAGASGVVDANTGSAIAHFNGAVHWTGGPVLGGHLVADAPSSNATPAWLRRVLPPKVSFGERGHLDGWLAYDPKGGIRLDSSLTAGRVQGFGETISNASVRMHYDPARMRASIDRANWHGAPVDGFIDYALKTKQLQGGLLANNVDLHAVGARLGVSGLSGIGRLDAMIAGTSAQPNLAFRASGEAAYKPAGGKRLSLGVVRVAGALKNNRVVLDQATVNGPAGSIVASGAYGLSRKDLDFKLDAAGVDLSAIRSDLGGVASFVGRVNGTLSNPNAVGRAQVYAFQGGGQQVPIVLADIQASPQRLIAKNLRAVKGGSEATGNVALNLKSKAISGDLQANNLQLSDFLGENVLGTVDVPDVRLSGTLTHPRASGSASAKNILAGGFQINQASLTGELADKELRVRDFKASALDGTVTGSGTYNFGTKAGTGDLQANNLALRRVLPSQTPSTALSGTVSGSANVAFNSKGLVKGDAAGSLADVVLNGTAFGQGPWEVHGRGHEVTGSVQVGLLDRYIQVSDASYNTDSKEIGGNLVLYHNKVQDLYTSLRPYFASMPEKAEEFVRTTDGTIDANVAFSGPPANPNLNIQVLNATNISLGGRPGGDLHASLTRTGTDWTIQQFNWAGAPGNLIVSGTVDEQGALRLDGELSGFDLSYLSLFDPNLSALRGKADVSFLASGATGSPVIDASLRTAKDSGVGFASDAAAGAQPQQELQIVLDTIHIQESTGNAGGMTAEGKFFYQGFEGDVTAHVPVKYPARIPEGSEITASLVFPKRDLKDFKQFVKALDTEKTKGTLEGRIDVAGVLNALRLSGNITTTADSLAFQGMQTSLKATVASLSLGDGRVDLSLVAESAQGGSVSAKYGFVAPEVSRLVELISRGQVEDLGSIAGEGAVDLQRFAVRQAIGDDGSVTGAIGGNLGIGGTIGRPAISGALTLANTSIVSPSKPLETGAPVQFPVDPQLNVKLAIQRQARFKTSTAELALSGTGQLNGSGSEPDFSGELRVQSGTIRLPTTRVALEPGGLVRPIYQVNRSGETNARLDVDIEGHTALTALRYGDTVERYDITLGIHGDLLREGGMTLTASSDPPDLSQDRILALLGQVDVIEGLVAQGFGHTGDTERRIQNALAGFALPMFLDPLTAKIASTLGLEYLNIDYNAFEGTSLDFAKSIGKGLIIQGRRQISPPTFGQKQRYDLRLTYRLPFRNKQLRRVVFSVGLDQDRPWKMAVEYGFRF